MDNIKKKNLEGNLCLVKCSADALLVLFLLIADISKVNASANKRVCHCTD